VVSVGPDSAPGTRSVTGWPEALSEVCAASRILTISTPSGCIERVGSSVHGVREIGQFEASGSAGSRRGRPCRPSGSELVLAEVLGLGEVEAPVVDADGAIRRASS